MRKMLAAVVVAFAIAPASAGASTEGLARCIVRAESTTARYPNGGDPNAVNGQYHGIAQWSPEAWRRHGGRQYAGDPLWASYGEQWAVLVSALRRFGCRDWCPFDPC